MDRFKGYESRPWVIEYWGTCSDTGKFYKKLRFNSKKEADQRYDHWINTRELGLSDGPECMSEPFYDAAA